MLQLRTVQPTEELCRTFTTTLMSKLKLLFISYGFEVMEKLTLVTDNDLLNKFLLKWKDECSLS